MGLKNSGQHSVHTISSIQQQARQIPARDVLAWLTLLCDGDRHAESLSAVLCDNTDTGA